MLSQDSTVVLMPVYRSFFLIADEANAPSEDASTSGNSGIMPVRCNTHEENTLAPPELLPHPKRFARGHKRSPRGRTSGDLAPEIRLLISVPASADFAVLQKEQLEAG